jgi:uroporphyrinogen-III synthase
MSELASGLEAMGGDVLPLSLIEVREIDDTAPLDAAVEFWNKYAWVIFSSVHGVDIFLRHWRRRAHRMKASDMPKICAVGPATGKAVEDHGLAVELVPESYVAEGVIEALEKYHGGLGALAGRRILLPRAKEARDVLPDALAAAGAIVDVVACYETVPARLDEDSLRRLRSRSPDLAVFTSSSAVKALIRILGVDEGSKMLHNATVAVLGPVTAGTAESFGKHPEIVAQESTIRSLLRDIAAYYGKRPGAAQ